MARSPFPTPSQDQLRQLAAAAEANAIDLAADARVLLEAGRFARAHALATLSLEELGKQALCLEMLEGELTEREFRTSWSNHLDKLERSSVQAILSATTVERVFSWYGDDAAVKMRGLYVDANPHDPDGPPLCPSDIDPEAARGIVEVADRAASMLWTADATRSASASAREIAAPRTSAEAGR